MKDKNAIIGLLVAVLLMALVYTESILVSYEIIRDLDFVIKMTVVGNLLMWCSLINSLREKSKKE